MEEDIPLTQDIFKTNIKSNFASLMAESVKDTTPYDKAIKFIEDAAAQDILDSKEKVEIIANMMASIVTGTTSKAMETAVIMERDAQTIIYDIQNKENTIALQDEKIKQEKNTVKLQDEKIKQEQDNTQLSHEKLSFEKRMVEIRIEGAFKDLQTKGQKLLTEEIKNGGINFEYIFYKSYYDDDGKKVDTDNYTDDTITVDDKEYILFNDYKRIQSKTINKGNGISSVELAMYKVIEDTNFIATQSKELSASVIYNNKVKALNSLSELFGTLGAGGMIINDTGWTTIFDLVEELSNITTATDGFQAGISDGAVATDDED